MNLPLEFWVSVFELLSIYDLHDRVHFGVVCRLFLSIWLNFKERHILAPLCVTEHLPRVFIHGYQTDYPDPVQMADYPFPLALINGRCTSCGLYIFHFGTTTFGIQSSLCNSKLPLLVDDGVIDVCHKCIESHGYQHGFELVAEKLGITVEEIEEMRDLRFNDIFLEQSTFVHDVDASGTLRNVRRQVKIYAKHCGARLDVKPVDAVPLAIVVDD